MECGNDTSPASNGAAGSNCRDVTITSADSFTPACGSTGVITRTWTATGSQGSTSCTQKITIVDRTSPKIGGQGGNQTIECPATPSFTLPTTSDTCGRATVIEDSDITTSVCPGSYNRTKTWHAVDECGNRSGQVSQTITVVDTTPPVISPLPAPATVYCPATPQFTTPTVTDSCSTATLTYSDSRTDGSCGSYRVTRTWKAQDACGNVSLASQTITVECNNCGGLSMGFWQNKNGQAIIAGGQSTGGVCNSGTWLRQYAPFQDQAPTATCSQAANYVTNVIKSANASGASMNAMLKAQALATALDVYFSDPALGGNKINAPAPIGSDYIDSTHVCEMIDSGGGGSCGGVYQDATSAFGGAKCLMISQMLSYAASQSNPGGSIWYGNLKTAQEPSKNAFETINNKAAFGCLAPMTMALMEFRRLSTNGELNLCLDAEALPFCGLLSSFQYLTTTNAVMVRMELRP